MSGLATRNTIVAGILLLLAVCGGVLLLRPYGRPQPIKVGVLHSETGAISEQSVRDATLLAIEEINVRGGLLGRELVPVVVDGASDSEVFGRLAPRSNSCSPPSWSDC